MTPFAHIAGIPVEETALGFGPMLLAAGGLVTLKMRERWGRLRRRRGGGAMAGARARRTPR
ncbi:MAG: hypothetical protein JSU06_13925 [Actinobacteria bacterium]|nr:hypothetical protein [Actinomycetota bacterium]